jgi:hypothetical protein
MRCCDETWPCGWNTWVSWSCLLWGLAESLHHVALDLREGMAEQHPVVCEGYLSWCLQDLVHDLSHLRRPEGFVQTGDAHPL